MEVVSYHSFLPHMIFKQARAAFEGACQTRQKGQKICLVELDLAAPFFWQLFPKLDKKRKFINDFLKNLEGKSARRIKDYLFFHAAASFHFLLADPSLEAIAKEAGYWGLDIEAGLILDRLQEMLGKLREEGFARVVINAQSGFNTLFRQMLEKLPEIEMVVFGDKNYFQQFEKMYPNNRIR